MRSQLVELPCISRFRRLLVAGDLHGDYASLHSLLEIADITKDCIIFLGDYADRGAKGIEVISTLDKLFTEHPENVILLKGNHEDYTENGEPNFFPSTLRSEVESKKGPWKAYFETTLQRFLQKLRLAVIIPENLLFVHGGISGKIKTLDDLSHPSESMEKDIIWSDPFEGLGEHANTKRGGVGVEFGSDISLELCNRLGVKKIIRSHEPRKALKGPSYSHERRVVTIGSTRIYGGQPFALSFDPLNLLDIRVVNLS